MPGFDGALKCAVLPLVMSPVSKVPVSEVSVWGTPSLFSTVIVAPGETFRLDGLKAKLWMTTVVPDELGAGPGPAVPFPIEEHAVASTAIEMSRAPTAPHLDAPRLVSPGA